MNTRGYIRIGSIFGASINIHLIVFLAAAALLYFSVSNLVAGIVLIFSYLGILFFHEVGHAYLANKYGYLVESIQISLFHGTCNYSFYEHLSESTDHYFIAWGGVLAQLIIAIPIIVFVYLSGIKDFGVLGPAVVFLGYINFMIALVNLAPAPMLDGHMAWRAVPLLFKKNGTKKKSSKPKKGKLRIVK